MTALHRLLSIGALGLSVSSAAGVLLGEPSLTTWGYQPPISLPASTILSMLALCHLISCK